ncbi:hypothetical protein AWB69_03665 [Caballeronia udeis]|uniref:Uncharacterized protein n=1 Tax=Caballeronia udeis TaxID=1232866 RepID=A0A158H111_9BURK|nr:hypothetical protein [Caballeronia udeis]SAL37701.1 hypothetical protein AWB69_03665 [Caballeronia udeis]
MKPMSLLVCGIVVSSLGAGIPVYAGSPSGNFALRAQTQPSLQAWKKEPVRGGGAITETAPRGDLRGDIASNARARPEPERSNRPPKR